METELGKSCDSSSSAEHHMDWRLFSFVSVFWSFLALVACVTASVSSDGRPALTIMLVIPAILLGLTAALVYRSANPIPCPTLDSGAIFILIPCFCIYFMMFIRLVCAHLFSGNAAKMNFGKDCSEGECDSSFAFAFDLNSFAHFTQGSLIFLLSKDISSTCWPVSEKSRRRLLFLKQLFALGVCFYPTYSLIKRILAGTTNFARSSHFNNVTEWACGFAVGVCAIFPYQAVRYIKCYELIRSQSKTAESSKPFEILRIACGVSLFFSFLFSMVLLAITWSGSLIYR